MITYFYVKLDYSIVVFLLKNNFMERNRRIFLEVLEHSIHQIVCASDLYSRKNQWHPFLANFFILKK
jgi:hypothetical protein